MKRVLSVFLALFLLTGCAAGQTAPTQTTAAPTEVAATTCETTCETTEPVPEETEPPVIYADRIQEGSYEIEVESSSSMFRVVKCVLTVADGAMTADMTMSGQGYGFVYMGTGEEAAADDQESYIPFALEEDGMKTFTVPVEALNMELDCAAWSIKKEKWYDRTLVFLSDAIPAEAIVSE